LGTHREYDKIDDSDHEKAVARISEFMGAAGGTPEGDELDVLATLVDAMWAGYASPDLLQ